MQLIPKMHCKLNSLMSVHVCTFMHKWPGYGSLVPRLYLYARTQTKVHESEVGLSTSAQVKLGNDARVTVPVNSHAP